jgi:hypothetical protein
MMVSTTDQVLKTLGRFMPIYSFTSQKPASLMWEKNSEPDPIDSASNAGFSCGLTVTVAAIRPEAVTMATVAEPVASLRITAVNQPSRIGDRLTSCEACAITAPSPTSMMRASGW